MAEDTEIRRENFKRWAERLNGGKFSPVVVVEKLGRTPSLWSDLYHGRKTFGEKLARDIERSADLVRMSLDDPEGPRDAAFTQELLDAVSEAPAEQRTMLENIVRAALNMEALKKPNGSPRKPRNAA